MMDNKKDQLIKLLETERNESFEGRMLRLERQKNELLQQGYDALERKFKVAASLLLDYETKSEPAATANAKRKLPELNGKNPAGKRLQLAVNVSEMKTFAAVKSRKLMAKGFTFKSTRYEAQIEIWHLASERKYLVSKPIIVKILTPHKVRKLTSFTLPVALQQQFKKEAKDAYGIHIQSSFFEVNGQLLDLLRDVSTHSDIADEIANFLVQ